MGYIILYINQVSHFIVTRYRFYNAIPTVCFIPTYLLKDFSISFDPSKKTSINLQIHQSR